MDSDLLLRYSFEQWYPLVRKNAMKCRVVELPHAFSSYLEEDGMLLPAGVSTPEMDSQLSDDEDLVEVGGDEGVSPSAVDLGDLEQRLQGALDEVGGKAFVKLNFSAPTDAAWVTNGLKCISTTDIFYLLKASERITDDVNILAALKEQQEPHVTPNALAPDGALRANNLKLVVKKWANFHPAMEFRCFVCAGQLVGICQRECSAFYEFLLVESDAIAETISAFVVDGATTPLLNLFSSYTLDVYVDKNKRVWIVDVGPFGHRCDPLLFTWQELEMAAADVERRGMQCEMRVVMGESLTMQRSHNGSGGPLEAIDIAQGILPRGFEHSKTARSREMNDGTSSSDSDSDTDRAGIHKTT